MNSPQVFELGSSCRLPARSLTKRAAFDQLALSKRQVQDNLVMALFASTDTMLTNEQIAMRAKIPYPSATRVVNGLLASGRLVDRGQVINKSTDRARRVVGRKVPTQLDIFGGAA